MNKITLQITTLIFVLFISCNNNTNTIETQKSNNQKPNYIINEQLSLKNYSNIEGYQPNEGVIPDEKTAFKIAEIILKRIYGNDIIENEKPFSINLENNIWIIEGSLSNGVLGGVAYIEIKKNNGEILKVIHTK